MYIANYLNALTPYERALVLHQAQILWSQRRHKWFDPEEESDTRLIAGQWICNVIQRLSQEHTDMVIALVQELDDQGSIERLTNDLDKRSRYLTGRRFFGVRMYESARKMSSANSLIALNRKSRRLIGEKTVRPDSDPTLSPSFGTSAALVWSRGCLRRQILDT
jgi:hypothetical protein